MMLEPEARAALRKLLEHKFTLEELKSLADDLGVNYQTLSHATTIELSRELVEYFGRRDDLEKLSNRAWQLRPHVDIAALYPKMAADAPRHPVPAAAEGGIQAGLSERGMHRTARSEEAQMSSRIVDWLQLLANVVQIVSLPISLLLVMRPDLIAGFHISPIVLQAIFVALLVLFMARLLASGRQRVQAQRRQRAAHREDQLPHIDRLAVAVDEHVRTLTLTENYVEPRLLHTGQIENGARATEEWRPLRVLRHTVAARQAGVVIWGMAGAGKTALARWLAQQIALSGDRDAWQFLQRRVMDETPSDNSRRRRVLDWRVRGLRWLGLEPSEYDLYYPFVFYVELSQADFGKDTRPGADAILACLENPAHLSDVSALARRKRILPIFDGFDQLTLDGQKNFLESLQEFLRQYRGNEPFILTSRHPLRDDQIRDLGVDQRVAQWQMLPFSSAQVQQYIEKYYSRGGGLQADRTEKLWQAIRKTAQTSPRVWQLLAEPMLLGMIAFTFDPQEQTIDTDRVTIYEKYLEKLVLRRHPDADSAKSNAVKADVQRVAVKADVQRVRKLLGAVAHRELLTQRTVFPVAQMTAEEQQALVDFEGILTWATSESSFTFSHMTMQCFFAAVHLAGQLKTTSPDAVRDLWRETVGRSVASAGDRRPKDNSDDERWRAYWRDALVMAAGMLTPRAVGRKLEDDWIYPAVQGVRSGAPLAQSRVLFLRLLGAIRERSPLPSNAIGQESLVPWLSALARPEALAADAWWYWQRDIGEVGELLTPEDWQELGRQAGIPESADQALRLLSALRHEQSAEIIIKVALGQCRTPQEVEDDLYGGRMTKDVKAALAEGCVSAQIQDALRFLGALAVMPLVREYHRAEGEYREAVRADAVQPARDARRRLGLLLEMMGYVGYAQELNVILNPNGRDNSTLKDLTPIAYLALSRWGVYGVDALEGLLRDAQRITPSQRTALALALAEAPIEGKLPDQYRWHLGQDRAQRTVVVEVMQEKLKLEKQLSPSDRRAVDEIFQRDQGTYARNASSRWRGILRWLEGRYMYRPVGPAARGRFNLWRWLHGSLRSMSTPTPLMLKSMLEISGGADCELSRRWIMAALRDPCLEMSQDAEDAFAALSMQDLTDPYRWWEEIRYELRPEVSERLEDRLDREMSRLQEQIAASSSQNRGKN